MDDINIRIACLKMANDQMYGQPQEAIMGFANTLYRFAVGEDDDAR